MEIKKGMKVYLSDEMMELNKMFIKKNGPYEVKDVFTAFGVEMAHLIVEDPSFVSINDYGIMTFPTSELYTKDTKADGSKPITLEYLHKSATETPYKLCPENFMDGKDAFKELIEHMIKAANTVEDEEPEEVKDRYFYKLDNGKTVVSGERLRMDESILVSDDETNKYYIVSVATHEIGFSNNEEPDYTFVMSMDAIALNEALVWKIFSNNERTKEIVRKELNINTLEDLNKYDFITDKKLETILLNKLIETTGQPEIVNVLKLTEAKEIMNKAIEKLAKEMGYMKMNKVTWLYYKRETQMPKRVSAARIISSTNKTE
mgnify:CR=1 FL=1